MVTVAWLHSTFLFICVASFQHYKSSPVNWLPTLRRTLGEGENPVPNAQGGLVAGPRVVEPGSEPRSIILTLPCIFLGRNNFNIGIFQLNHLSVPVSCLLPPAFCLYPFEGLCDHHGQQSNDLREARK